MFGCLCSFAYTIWGILVEPGLIEMMRRRTKRWQRWPIGEPAEEKPRKSGDTSGNKNDFGSGSGRCLAHGVDEMWQGAMAEAGDDVHRGESEPETQTRELW